MKVNPLNHWLAVVLPAHHYTIHPNYCHHKFYYCIVKMTISLIPLYHRMWLPWRPLVAIRSPIVLGKVAEVAICSWHLHTLTLMMPLIVSTCGISSHLSCEVRQFSDGLLGRGPWTVPLHHQRERGRPEWKVPALPGRLLCKKKPCGLNCVHTDKKIN